MYKVLIVDGPGKGRIQIRRHLEQMELPLEIREAQGYHEAMDVMNLVPCDILITDVDTSESLVKEVRDRFPQLPILIFCTYEDFARAEKQESYGWVHCCLLPISGNALEKLVRDICHSIDESEDGNTDNQITRQRYFLNEYLLSGRKEPLEGADLELFGKWHRAILIESAQNFFDAPQEDLVWRLERELHRPFFYLNLNTKQSLLLFHEVYCDYNLIGKHIYVYLKRKTAARFFVSISKQFEGYAELSRIVKQLDAEMEEQYYHPETHIYTSEEEAAKSVSEEAQDSDLIYRISDDISRKDVVHLKKHFGFLVEKYQKQTQFSAMYVKFVFSSVLQELFQEPAFARERQLEKEIDRLYSYSDMGRILDVTRQALADYEMFLERHMEQSLRDVRATMESIRLDPQEDSSLEELSSKIHMSPGYFHYLFSQEAGMSLPRFRHVCRLQNARERIEQGETGRQICRSVGFDHYSYFVRAFEEFFGYQPE